MKTGYKILLATLKTFHTTSYTRTRKCQSSLNIIIMASIQKCTIFHLKNMRKGTSFSLIFPVLIVITLAHNCTRILVQLCDTFTLSFKLVIWCVGSRNNSDSQESSSTNMSTDMNVWNFNFCSLDNASKTLLNNILWYIGIRNNSDCQESYHTNMSTSTNVKSSTSVASAMLTKGTIASLPT